MSAPAEPGSPATSANSKLMGASSIASLVACLESVNQTGGSRTATGAAVSTRTLERTATYLQQTSVMLLPTPAKTVQSVSRKVVLATLVCACRAGPETTVQISSICARMHRAGSMAAVTHPATPPVRSHASAWTGSQGRRAPHHPLQQTMSVRRHHAKTAPTVRKNKTVMSATVSVDLRGRIAKWTSTNVRVLTSPGICERSRRSRLV